MKGAWLRRPTKDMLLVRLSKRCLTPARREGYTSKAFPNDNLLLDGPTRSNPRANAWTPALVPARARQHSEASEARACEPPLCPALQPVAFLRLRWAPGARPVDPEPHIRRNLHLSEWRSWTPPPRAPDNRNARVSPVAGASAARFVALRVGLYISLLRLAGSSTIGAIDDRGPRRPDDTELTRGSKLSQTMPS